MIQSIVLKNFKSIKDKVFNLGNLNVLSGMNGQGKSSFIQSLLLLRQSGDKLSKGKLALNGDLVRIGSFRDALYQYAKGDLEIGLTTKDGEALNMALSGAFDTDVLDAKDFDQALSDGFFAKADGEALFGNPFQYLNADRIEPTSLHGKSLSTISENNLGIRGEYTAHYLEVNGDKPVLSPNCLHPDTILSTDVFGQRTKDKRIIHQVNLWLGEISPGVNVKTKDISSASVLLQYDFNQPNIGRTNLFDPENVGFGISYALHVVTALLAASPGSLLIIENPESHIHPRGQAELGKLIALVAQNDVQVVIETHSDHVLNGIRAGVKENPALKDKTVLFYFRRAVEKDEQFSLITDIKIDKNGTLSDCPEGLLDEWGNQLLNLL